MKKSDQFFYSCLAFLVGIALGEIWQPQFFYYLFAIAGAVLVIIFLRKYRFISAVLLCLIFGLYLNAQATPRLDVNHISFYNNQKITFKVKIIDAPDVRLDKQRLLVAATEKAGRVLLTTPLYPEYQYGDRLVVTCFLQKPEKIEDFRYDKYLALSRVYSICYSPYIKVEGEGGNFILSSLYSLKNKVEGNINRTLSEPAASLMAGILIGSRAGINSDLLQKFNIVGITHIIAISGFNITIIVALLLNLAKYLRLGRKRSFWIIVAMIVLFVIFVGASASVVRAGVMGVLVLFAKHLGRTSKTRNVLILTAVIMTALNPKILIWDAGFQLSFLSTLGLIYLSPLLEKYLAWLPEKFALRENSATTFSAIIFTLPIILYNFERLSLVAPLVNLLVLPVIPISMLFGFIQIIFSSIFLPLGQIVAWFSWLFLTYVVKIVELFSALPFASVNIGLNWWMMIILYMMLVWFMSRGVRKIGDRK